MARALAQAPESSRALLQPVSGAWEAEPTIAEQLEQAELKGQAQQAGSTAATRQLDHAQTTTEVEPPADFQAQSPEALPDLQPKEVAASASIAACSDAVASQRQPEPCPETAQQGDSHLVRQHSGAAQLQAGPAAGSPVESDVMGFSPGISDQHCMSALPQTKQKRKRMSERDWIAEQGEGMGGFGLQMMATPAAAKDQRKSSSKKRPAMVESVQAQLQARKARKTEQRCTAAGGLASIEEQQQEQPRPYHDCRSGGDGAEPSDAAALPEDSGEAWNGMIAEELASQPSRARLLPDDETGGACEAACNSTPAPPKQSACAAKTMSPTYLQRRSARGVCPAEALSTPSRVPAGAAPDSRRTAQEPDAACTISLSADGQDNETAEPAAKKQAKAAGPRNAAQEASARAQLRQAGADLKAMKARGVCMRRVYNMSLMCGSLWYHTHCQSDHVMCLSFEGLCHQGCPACRCLTAEEGINIIVGHRRDRGDRVYREQGQQRDRQARCLKGPGKAEGARSSCKWDGESAHVLSKQAFKMRQATFAVKSMARNAQQMCKCTAH